VFKLFFLQRIKQPATIFYLEKANNTGYNNDQVQNTVQL